MVVLNDLHVKILSLAASRVGLKLFIEDNVIYFTDGTVLINRDIGNFGINSVESSLIAKDKCSTFQHLNRCGIPAIPHSAYALASSIALLTNKEYSSYVLKDRFGMKGEGFRVLTKEEVLLELAAVIRNENECLSPYVDADIEYRVTVVNGKVKLIYGKIKDPNTGQHNLNKGATVVDCPPELRNSLEDLALRSAKSLGLIIANVDILHTDTDKLLVLEVNASVTLNIVVEQKPSLINDITDIYTEILNIAKSRLLSSNLNSVHTSKGGRYAN